MAADSDNEMRDFTDSEGEQERWEERRVQGLVSGLSKCRPFYAPNIFAIALLKPHWTALRVLSR